MAGIFCERIELNLIPMYIFRNAYNCFPSDKVSIMVNKNDLDAALKRTTIMVDKKVSRIIFKISSGVLKLISPESEIGTADEEIPCRYDGQSISMALNFTYVTEPLKVIDSENVVFDFNINETSGDEEANITKAVIMRSEPAADYIHVIMPMNY